MENRRLQWFLVAIGAGLVFGLILGWSVFPRKAADMTLRDLREDYKVDYCLMVATVYHQDQDLAAAKVRLAEVAPELEDQVELLKTAMGISSTPDIQILGVLLNALQGSSSGLVERRAS